MTPTLDEYIKTKQAQVKNWEQLAESRAHDASEKVTEHLAVFRTKRDNLVLRLEGLREETSQRVDVLRMGVESAWDELRVAFETATASDPNAKAVH